MTASVSFVASFDVEEHDRIEAAYGLDVPAATKAEYARRMEVSTRRLLELLADARTLATFYVVGEIAVSHPKLVKDIADAGHEVGCHSWRHESVRRQSEVEFREDVTRAKGALEAAAGVEVVGYRAPTFSIGRHSPWAIDVLAESGYQYDSSIFPVLHDRYGDPAAPRSPFVVTGLRQSLLELPPATWRVGGHNLPVAGGGYFRLCPWAIMRRGLRKYAEQVSPALGMTYFHPWEFDPGQPQLPMSRLRRLRTYTGIRKLHARVADLLRRFPCVRAVDAVRGLDVAELPQYALAPNHVMAAG